MSTDLDQLSDEELAAIAWAKEWYKKIARPKQIMPAGEWSKLLLLAGRGFGKSLTGGRWIALRRWSHPETIGHVIAPTWSDVIQTCFEGPAGILSHTPPELIADWNKSDAILEFTNGSKLRGFSAEKPDRMRGPQCLIGDTLVLMGDESKKPIRDVIAGEFVMTRKGPRKVTWSCLTARDAELWKVTLSDGRTIVGTGNHPIWVDELGFTAISDIQPGSSACVTGVSVGMARRGTPTAATITNAGNTATSSGFTEKNTLPKLGQSQMDTTFTTRTATDSTTTSPTSKSCLPLNMRASTPPSAQDAIQKPSRRRCGEFGSPLSQRSIPAHNAVECSCLDHQTLDNFALPLALISGETMPSPESRGRATNARRPIGQQSPANDTVAEHVTIEPPYPAGNSSPSLYNAPIAHPRSFPQEPTPDSAADHARSLSTARISAVEKLATRAPVYDLTVEDQHEFFANGILVHNCHDIWADEVAAWQYLEEAYDMAMFGLRLGDHVRALFTTTPKPKPKIIELIRAAEAEADKPIEQRKTIVVRGSTYENKANLAQNFLDEVLKYEGTILGRQEIHAEIIDPEEQGIIKKSWFKLWPSEEKLPVFRYIVLSLDTAFTEAARDKKTGDPDPTAGTVWGIFEHPKEPGRDCVMLLDAWQDHLGFPDLLTKTREELKVTYGEQQEPTIKSPFGKPALRIAGGRKPDILIIEEKGSGISLKQALARESIEAYGYNPGKASKLERLHAVAHFFANGIVWIPESKKIPEKPVTWAEDMIQQLCTFSGEGSIKHDDYVDSATQAIRFLTDKHWVTLKPKAPRDPAAEVHRPPAGNPYKR